MRVLYVEYIQIKEVDPHSLCSSCRGSVCSPFDTCPDCESWNEVQWVRYSTKKKKAAKKSPKKTNVPSPLASTSASAVRASLPASPTQSRGRGKSVAGKRPAGLPQESDLPDSGVMASFQASEGPEGGAGVFSGDGDLVPAGHVSSDDPMWGNNATNFSPASWACISGGSAAEGDVEKEHSPPSGPTAWVPHKMPFRSPMRMEDDFGTWVPTGQPPRSPPAPSAVFPEVFLQESSSTERRRNPPTSPREPRPSKRAYKSSVSSMEDPSCSSEDEALRNLRRQKGKSRRKLSRSRSPSRSRHERRRPRSPKNNEWVMVHRDRLLELAAARGPSGWRPRTASPDRYSSGSSGTRQRDSSWQVPVDRHKTAKVPTPSAQRRESPLRSGS
ncbi:serine/arginine-rich splicing factor 7-like [Palaemon carinicauda]|uniref:serine/arginine-rich splicing factor 7-like n=1 Tax=Palaemon carinicauda TaxID=392227 RepID=UPI0035B5FFC2